METSKPTVTDSSATVSDGSNTETDSEIHNLTTTNNTNTNTNTHTNTIPESISQPDQYKYYYVGQKVLARHKDVFYDARVIKVQYQKGAYRFKVHYVGWKTRWDEWLTANNLMEYTEEDKKKYGPLNEKQEIEKDGKLAQASTSNSESTKVERGKKRKIDSAIKENDSMPMEKSMNIQIPSRLKKQLFDDCEFVNHMGKLVKLPRIPNVNDIFIKYLEYRERKDGILANSVQQFMRRFRSYFDKALPAMLLYKSERQQFEQSMVDGASPSSVYGAEHLLRLFVKFPELLSVARNDDTIEEEELADFQKKLVDLLKFLRKNWHEFFLSTYSVAEDIETSTTKEQDDNDD